MEWYEDLYNRQIYFDLYSAEDTQLARQEVARLVELLPLESGQSILDVCCGYGRHAIELAKRGYKVAGIDLSSKQIEAAIKRAKEAGVEVNFMIGDAREMSFQEEFDITLSLFVSFGFFQAEAENLKMLENIARATVPGGLFLMDFWNREKQLRDFTPLEVEERTGGIRVEKRWVFDPLDGRINWQNTVIFPDGKTESWDHSVRAYTLVELKYMLEKVGFQLERVYGDFDGHEYTMDSPNMITISRKFKESGGIG